MKLILLTDTWHIFLLIALDFLNIYGIISVESLEILYSRAGNMVN